MKKIIIFSLVVFFVSSYEVYSQKNNVKVKGFADTYHAVESKKMSSFLSSRSRLRAELNFYKRNSYLFTSLNAVHNDILPEETKIELRELFLNYGKENWNVKIGRQIVIWGNSDGMRITDLVSPMDMTEFLARDYDDIRMPVDAIRLQWTNTKMQAELIYIPIPEFFIIPYSKDNPWTVFRNTGKDYDVSEYRPNKSLKNSEIGGKLSFFLPGFDMSITALRTWNKKPVYTARISEIETQINLDAHYSRMSMIGLNFSLPLSKFVIRGEAAEYIDELYQTKENSYTSVNSFNSLIGADYYPGDEWTITAQYSHKIIQDYKKSIESDKNTQISTLSITKKLIRSTLSLSTFTYYDITNKSSFTRASADYALSDEIHIILGYDYFTGNKGLYGKYKDNSEIWFKAKYSF